MRGSSRRARRGAVAIALTCMVAGSSCGGRAQPVYEVAPGGLKAASQLPKVVDSVPAFVIRSKKPLRAKVLHSIERVEGTALVSQVAIDKVKVEGPKGAEKLDVAAVDPVSYRSVAPLATRDADFVWTSLLAGDVVLTDDAAKTLGVHGSGQVRFAGGKWTRIGAFADNGAPNLADVLIAAPKTRVAKNARVAIVGVKSGTTLEAVASSLRKKVHAKVSWLIPKRKIVASAPQTLPASYSSLPTVAGLQPAMSVAVNQLVAASHGRIWIVSGYRDSAKQYQLWVGALQKYGSPEAADNWVAPPGHSMHERGLAVDLGGDLNLAVQLIQQLHLPLWRPMSWEAWHFELLGSRG